jgi:hypothetical protein
MFDRDKLQADLKYGKQYRPISTKKKEWSFSFARPAIFDDGDYQMRFLPHNDTRCPDGYRIISFHRVEQVAGQKAIGVLGAESQEEDQKSFYIDSLLSAISDAHEQDPDFNKKMSPGLKDALEKLYPWRRYVFPSIWWAESYQVPGKLDNRGEPLLRYRPNFEGPPIGILWEVNAPPGGNAPRLIQAIVKISDVYQDFNQKKKGRNFQFSKQGFIYQLLPEPAPEPFPKEVDHLLGEDHYPKLAQMYKTSNKSHNEIVSLIQNSWWAPELEELGISLEDDDTADLVMAQPEL